MSIVPFTDMNKDCIIAIPIQEDLFIEAENVELQISGPQLIIVKSSNYRLMGVLIWCGLFGFLVIVVLVLMVPFPTIKKVTIFQNHTNP